MMLSENITGARKQDGIQELFIKFYRFIQRNNKSKQMVHHAAPQTKHHVAHGGKQCEKKVRSKVDTDSKVGQMEKERSFLSSLKGRVSA